MRKLYRTTEKVKRRRLRRKPTRRIKNKLGGAEVSFDASKVHPASIII